MEGWDSGQVLKWLQEEGLSDSLSPIFRDNNVSGHELSRLKDCSFYSSLSEEERRGLVRAVERTICVQELGTRWSSSNPAPDEKTVLRWTEEEVQKWLEKRNLSRYSDIFSTNEIDGQILSEMDREDFRLLLLAEEDDDCFLALIEEAHRISRIVYPGLVMFGINPEPNPESEREIEAATSPNSAGDTSIPETTLPESTSFTATIESSSIQELSTYVAEGIKESNTFVGEDLKDFGGDSSSSETVPSNPKRRFSLKRTSFFARRGSHSQPNHYVNTSLISISPKSHTPHERSVQVHVSIRGGDAPPSGISASSCPHPQSPSSPAQSPTPQTPGIPISISCPRPQSPPAPPPFNKALSLHQSPQTSPSYSPLSVNSQRTSSFTFRKKRCESPFLEVPAGNPGEWSCAQIGRYLPSIGMGRYVKLFRKQEIDGDTLLLMNERDLRVLRVDPFDRTIILEQIRKLRKLVQVEVSLTFGDETHSVRLIRKETIETFNSKIKEILGEDQIFVKFEDEEGDLVTIRNTYDVRTLIKMASNKGPISLIAKKAKNKSRK